MTDTINTNPAPNPFDPAALRLDQSYADTVGVKKLLTTVPVRKPNRQDFVRSGRIEARTGLRMMPTFPRSPLSFRTAGFPQYGWKAGISGETFPARHSA